MILSVNLGYLNCVGLFECSLTFLTTMFPCSSVYFSSVTVCDGISGKLSACKKKKHTILSVHTLLHRGVQAIHQGKPFRLNMIQTTQTLHKMTIYSLHQSPLCVEFFDFNIFQIIFIEKATILVKFGGTVVFLKVKYVEILHIVA